MGKHVHVYTACRPQPVETWRPHAEAGISVRQQRGVGRARDLLSSPPCPGHTHRAQRGHRLTGTGGPHGRTSRAGPGNEGLTRTTKVGHYAQCKTTWRVSYAYRIDLNVCEFNIGFLTTLSVCEVTWPPGGEWGLGVLWVVKQGVCRGLGSDTITVWGCMVTDSCQHSPQD